MRPFDPPALALLVLLGGVAAAGDPPADLTLEAALVTPARIQPGDPVQVSLRLVNRSKTAVRSVPVPIGDAHADPSPAVVTYSARVDVGRGSWRDVEPLTLLRCGNVPEAPDPAPRRDLGPGEALDLSDLISYPSVFLDFQDAGRVELRVRYRFALPGKDGAVGEPVEILSGPVALEVVRPLEVVTAVTGTAKEGEPIRLSAILSARLENRGEKPFPPDSSKDWIGFLVKPGGGVEVVLRTPVEGAPGLGSAPLKAGESRVLIGKGGAYDEDVVLRGKGEILVAVSFGGGGDGRPRVRSSWVTLRVL